MQHHSNSKTSTNAIDLPLDPPLSHTDDSTTGKGLQGYPPLRDTTRSDNGTIKHSHYREWLASAVDREIIDLNVRSLEGDEAIERLTENAIARIGKGQKFPIGG
jgi:hypothetical protein